MKSEHRHELKTNELAEWMSNFPSWAKENAKVLIPTIVVLACIGAYFFWSQSSTLAEEQNRAEFTESLSRLLEVKNRVAAESSSADDMPLLLTAQHLEGVAASSTSDGMAAFALIKRAEALRSAAFFQTRQTPEDIALQIKPSKTLTTVTARREKKPSITRRCWPRQPTAWDCARKNCGSSMRRPRSIGT